MLVNRYFVVFEPEKAKVNKSTLPFHIGNGFYFLGYGLRKLRGMLAEKFSPCHFREIRDNLFVAVFIRRKRGGKGQLIWSGRIRYVMTFEKAFELSLKKSGYSRLLSERGSPLFVEPLYRDDLFIGYKLRSKTHSGNFEWIRDLTSLDDPLQYLILTQDNKLLLKDVTERYFVFDRDITAIMDMVYINYKALEKYGLMKTRMFFNRIMKLPRYLICLFS
ncbi:MAG: hypothetical protein B6U94_06570 [Thermofilum sp. ex4484_79]|nr:MAG: hypothetical protein B6U94_06570 [Thermofilum sp. ex4484_79]